MKKETKKIKDKKLRPAYWQAGMSYVELIVVLSIFSAMTSIILFNYGDFQARVDIKNLASDIALKVVGAQKSSLSGQLPPSSQYNLIVTPATWKPSYGVYFNSSMVVDTDGIPFNKKFIYFTDLDNTFPPQNNLFDGSGSSCTGECLDNITITKNNSISSLDVFYYGGSTNNLTKLTVTFKRPSSLAVLKSTPTFTEGLTVNYVQITIKSPKETRSVIKIYPSGRIQIN